MQMTLKKIIQFLNIFFFVFLCDQFYKIKIDQTQIVFNSNKNLHWKKGGEEKNIRQKRRIIRFNNYFIVINAFIR